MITVTPQLEQAFKSSPLYSKDGQGLNATVIAKFFMPFTEACWLITEAEQEENDWLLFGYCHIFEWEFGYVRLSEIRELDVKGITAEQDLTIPKGATVKDCLKNLPFAED